MSLVGPAPALGTSTWFGADGWGQIASLRLLDLVVAVHSDDLAVLDLVDALYAPARVDEPGTHALFLGRVRVDGGEGYVAAVDGGALVRTPAPGVAFRHLVYEANQMAIDATEAPVRLHAGAAARGGRAVAFVGPMGAGKSTLTAGLVTRGWEYLTDEVVATDDRGRVRPYPKPCSLAHRPPGLTVAAWAPPLEAAPYLGDAGLVPAPVLGAVAGTPVPLGAVVLPRHRRGGTTEVTEVAPADALVEIGAHAFGLASPGALAALHEVIRGVPCFRVVSGDVAGACDAIEAVLGFGA